MRALIGCVLLLFGMTGPVAARAQLPAGSDSGAFLIRIGHDTLAVERFDRTAHALNGEYVTRSPKTTRVKYVAHLDDAGTTVVGEEVTFVATGNRIELQRDGRLVRQVIARAGYKPQFVVDTVDDGYVMPLLEPTFALHQLLVSRAHQSTDTVPFTWAFVGGGVQPGGSVVRAQSPDTVYIRTPTDTIHVAVDRHGRILSTTDVGGTLQATVTRIPWPDLDRWQATFAERDAAGKGLGMLSPRDTVRATVGGAHVLVDYSRPTRRGRVIFGAVVPFNTVWRTGANAATTFVTDHDIVIGQTPVPAGTYTLFSVPAPDGWQLIVSKTTGEWGTDYDPKADLARIPMSVGSSPAPLEKFTIAIVPNDAGASLTMAWDKTVATVPLRAAGGGATTGR
jgi:hypothetical protein